MATTTADNIQIIGGVDTHQDPHTAAVVSHDGTVLGENGGDKSVHGSGGISQPRAE